ncbi:F-box/LRR-repeat protein 7 [Anabrus simplex]|uniref:F-box/LRR-repeat protein 7 n=1 Tax=Anabrus simplex TaxID=316456 RepID=UPI0035A3285C
MIKVKDVEKQMIMSEFYMAHLLKSITWQEGVQLRENVVSSLAYAYDLVLMAGCAENLQSNNFALENRCNEYDMKISLSRTKMMSVMAHVPPPSRSSAALLGRLSPMVCPLAKLGRSSPSMEQYHHLEHGYQHQAYHLQRGSPSLDQGYHHMLGGSSSTGRSSSPSLDCGVTGDFQLRGSPALRRASSPTLDHLQCYHQSPTLEQNYSGGSSSAGHHNKLGRASPSLDQGYHTLVSPSPGPSTPGPWSDTHPLLLPQSAAAGGSSGVAGSSGNGASAPAYKGKRPHSKSSPFERLPDDCVLRVFSWLDSSELSVCARVCRRWESLAWEPSLWRAVRLRGEGVCGDKAIRAVLRRLCGQGRTGACPNVERVLLSDGAKATDKGLTLLGRRCPELTHLQLHGCSAVTNPALFELAARCTNLQHLDLTGCSRISCISVTPGPEPPRRLLLQYLDLTDCQAVEDGGLRVIVRNCPHLVYLYLRRCIQITDAGIKYIPSFCSMLRELSVSDCNQVTDFGLYELAKLGATLRYLSVAKCFQVSDAGLKVIARRCYKLRYLNARGCEAVSDDAITVLARSCPRLRALDIGKCDVSDAGLRALAESCPNLKKLSLRSCDLVTDRGVQCVAYYCRGLQQLNIQDCQISLEGYRAVKKYCKRCIIEHTNPGFF